MNTIAGKAVSLVMVGLSVFCAVAPAAARDHGGHGDRHFDRHGGRHGHSGVWRHGHHHGRLGWWWVAGGLWYLHPRPVYPYPDPYRPPVVVVEQPASPVVVQAPAVPAPVQYWYYCEAAQGYYPYVPACPTGWSKVPATPPGATP